MAIVRAGLSAASIASLVLAIWLASVILLVLPTRDPEHIPLWTAVAIGAVALAVVSAAAIHHRRPTTGLLAAALGGLGLGATAFGLMVLGSSLSDALAGDPEGYLFLIGLVLVAHGALALAWLYPGGAAVRM